MSKLSDSFAQQHHLSEINYIYRAVEVGLKPWHPGRITAYQEENFSFDRYTPIIFTITTDLLPDLPCKLYPQLLLKSLPKLRLLKQLVLQLAPGLLEVWQEQQLQEPPVLVLELEPLAAVLELA